MKTALAPRHLAFEDLGLLAPLLRKRGFEIRYHEAGVDDFAAHSPPPASVRKRCAKPPNNKAPDLPRP